MPAPFWIFSAKLASLAFDPDANRDPWATSSHLPSGTPACDRLGAQPHGRTQPGAKAPQGHRKRFGVALALNDAPEPNSHVHSTDEAPLVERPAERDFGDEASPDFGVVDVHFFGLSPRFIKELKHAMRTYNAPSEGSSAWAA